MKRHYLILFALTAILSAFLVVISLNVKLTPASASAQAEPVDQLLRILLAIGSVILALCIVALVYNVVVFRRRKGDMEDGPPIQGHNLLEIAWVLVPLAIVLWLAFQGAMVLQEITSAPTGEEELEVKVSAFQWGWLFAYPAYGVISAELHLPVGRPVRFELTSSDVVHSLWVPEWRVKQDAVPGKVTELRITPTTAGEYKVLCAELCGLAHAMMKARVTVTERADFEQWVKEQKQ